MNYYIMPKNNFSVKIEIELTNDTLDTFLSHSLDFFLKDVKNRLTTLEQNEGIDMVEHMIKIVNPFEFIHSVVPGSSISVSKVKTESIVFYELLEMFQLFNISDLFANKKNINICNLTPNHASINHLLNMTREDNEDNIRNSEFCDFTKEISNEKYDLLVVEFDKEDYSNTKQYIKNVIQLLQIMNDNQEVNGIVIIKMDSIVYKPIVDFIYILSGMYDKVYIYKPVISDVTKNYRYLICIGKLGELTNTLDIIDNPEELCVKSLLKNEIPHYFINKIEDSNIIIGQQQIEALDQIINIFKNKNKEEKIESLKRIHVQKCIQWCEKYQLPHNKFIDKVNVFLTPKRPTMEIEIE